MPAPIPYFDLIREMENAFNHRLRLVAHRREYGRKNAARLRAVEGKVGLGAGAERPTLA